MNECPNQGTAEQIARDLAVTVSWPKVESGLEVTLLALKDLRAWRSDLRASDTGWLFQCNAILIALAHGISASDVRRYGLLSPHARQISDWREVVGYFERRRFRRGNRCIDCLATLAVKGCINSRLLVATLPASRPLLVLNSGSQWSVRDGWNLAREVGIETSPCRAVLKPLMGRWGIGIRQLQIASDGGCSLGITGGHWLVEEDLSDPERDDADFREPSTYRVLTVRDGGDLRAVDVVARFKTEKSGFVDNWSNGGIARAVDATTGELGKLVTKQGGNSAGLPARVDLVKLSEIRDLALDAHRLVPCLQSVGWDVYGPKPTIIEGNPDWDVVLHQMVSLIGLRTILRPTISQR